jgi:hypothetical protein
MNFVISAWRIMHACNCMVHAAPVHAFVIFPHMSWSRNQSIGWNSASYQNLASVQLSIRCRVLVVGFGSIPACPLAARARVVQYYAAVQICCVVQAACHLLRAAYRFLLLDLCTCMGTEHSLLYLNAWDGTLELELELKLFHSAETELELLVMVDARARALWSSSKTKGKGQVALYLHQWTSPGNSKWLIARQTPTCAVKSVAIQSSSTTHDDIFLSLVPSNTVTRGIDLMEGVSFRAWRVYFMHAFMVVGWMDGFGCWLNLQRCASNRWHTRAVDEPVCQCKASSSCHGCTGS